MHCLLELEVRELELVSSILWQRAIVVQVGGCVEYMILRYVVQVLVGKHYGYLTLANHIGFVVDFVYEGSGTPYLLDELDLWAKELPCHGSGLGRNNYLLNAIYGLHLFLGNYVSLCIPQWLYILLAFYPNLELYSIQA